MNPLLTEKQEKYVQGLITGLSQREAYRRAYNAKRMKDSTIDEKASRLLAQDKVRARYEGMVENVRSEAERNTVATAVQVLEELTALAMGYKTYPSLDMFGNPVQRPVSVSARLKALELLGKKYGLFEGREPEKARDNGLLTAIQQSAKEVWGDVSAVQSETEDGDDLVGAP